MVCQSSILAKHEENILYLMTDKVPYMGPSLVKITATCVKVTVVGEPVYFTSNPDLGQIGSRSGPRI
jgi:hypothetical protein